MDEIIGTCRVGTCRRELLDRMLIWNQAYLPHALREFETDYNLHRPHRSPSRNGPFRPVPRTRRGGTERNYAVREVGTAQEVSSERFTVLAMTCMPALLGCTWSPPS